MLHLDTAPTTLTLLQQIWDSNVKYNHTFSAMLWSDDRDAAVALVEDLAQGANANFLLYTAVEGLPPRGADFPRSLFEENARNIVLLDTPLFESAQCQRFLFNIFAERTAGFHPICAKSLVIGLAPHNLDTPYKKGARLGAKNDARFHELKCANNKVTSGDLWSPFSFASFDAHSGGGKKTPNTIQR